MLTGVFNPASVSALLSVVVSAIAAACALLLARVPDWDDVLPLAWVAGTAALVAGCNFTATLDVPTDVYLWTGRLQVTGIALHVAAWHLYLPGWAGHPLGARHRAALWGLLAVGVLALFPGAVYGGEVHPRPLAWLGVTYRDPVITPLGTILYAVILGYGLWGLALVRRIGRAGAAFPGAHLACTSAILAMAAHDALVLGGLELPTPYLLDFAFYGPITMLGLMTISRIGQSAIDLRHLNAGLADLVARRSSDLEVSQKALARAERLAALGQFAAGVAHEVNNPAAVVSASLGELAAELRDDPRDRVWTALRDAQAAVGRITGLAQQLLVAGRSAARPETPLAPVHAAAAVEAALGPARARGGPDVAFDLRLPADLHVQAHEPSLVQVLSNLLVNAAQAIPPGRAGHVVVRAEPAGDRVRLLVEDDGVGMSEEVLQRLFEPFSGTKPPGQGTGLGLAVSLGLVTSMQGALRYESQLGRGSRAILELRTAQASSARADLVRADDPAIPFRARILVIDDDEQVRNALGRMLGRTHDVFVADGVQQGLEALSTSTYDLVLCDVMMPNGGGERVWGELPLRAPWAMLRLAFITGGAPTGAARAFLAAQPRPVLMKPFEIADVDQLLRAVARPGGASDAPSSDSSASRPVGRLRKP